MADGAKRRSVCRAGGIAFPGRCPGKARGTADGRRLVLENDALAFEWCLDGGGIQPVCFTNHLSGTALDFRGSEAFTIILDAAPLAGATSLKASSLQLTRPPTLQRLRRREAPRIADRHAGVEVRAEFASIHPRLTAEWQATLRDGANYVRQHLTVRADGEPVPVVEIVMLEGLAAGAEVAGSVDGSPILVETMFFGVEHPRSVSVVEERATPAGAARSFRCSLPFLPGVDSKRPLSCSAVAGVFPPGQARRGFLYYLERERPQPYRQLLHYNNGYEIGCEYWQRRRQGDDAGAADFRRKQQQRWLHLIDIYGQELVVRRGIAMDCFAHDFEWDDETLVWQFHEGYPEGFAPARRAAEGFGARLGVWLSPWGGYACKAGRLAGAKAQGFEMNANGLSLAGPNYYARFRAACIGMIRNYDAAYFKFDGIAAGINQEGAKEFCSDVDALLRLIEELRAAKPEVFINVSTGSWPSPFWLLWADCVWRQGYDSDVAGDGPLRQRWITYRDSQVLHGTVQRGPLYPISSLMVHGIFIHQLPFTWGDENTRQTYDPTEIKAEIRSFFASGVNLQELYINPEVLPAEAWDVIAEAARWARENFDVLADTHWVGGDPESGEIYGWAAWTPRKGILTLRNPSAQAQSIVLDLEEVFELPPEAPREYALRSPWREDCGRRTRRLRAGEPHEFRLAPFEVAVVEAHPGRTKPSPCLSAEGL